VSQDHRSPARFLPKLVTQLVPAVVVTVVGALLLSNLTKVPDAVSMTAAVPAAITAEAVFTATPRPPDEQAAATAEAARPAAKPKAIASQVPPPPRKPVEDPRPVVPRQVASLPAPPPIVILPAQPQVPARETTVMGRLWGATTAVAGMPVRAAQSVTGWFATAIPPRPPAPVPFQGFQAAM
jgi:hypothetical protein